MLEQMRRSKAGQSVTSNRRQATRKHGHPTGLPKGEGVFPEGHLPSRPPKPAPDGRTDGRTGMREGRLHRGSGCRTGLRARTPLGMLSSPAPHTRPPGFGGAAFPRVSPARAGPHLGEPARCPGEASAAVTSLTQGDQLRTPAANPQTRRRRATQTKPPFSSHI